jgi:predicted aldo/keto reductase-like oxidoreductase
LRPTPSRRSRFESARDPLRNKIVQQIFTPEEFKAYAQKFKTEWLEDIPNVFDHLQGRFSSDDEISLYKDFKNNLEYAQEFYAAENLEDDLSELYAQLDEHIEHLQSEKLEPSSTAWQSSMPTGEDVAPSATSADSSAIFDDVDD